MHWTVVDPRLNSAGGSTLQVDGISVIVTGCWNTGLSQVTVAVGPPVAVMSPGHLETIGGMSTAKKELGYD